MDRTLRTLERSAPETGVSEAELDRARARAGDEEAGKRVAARLLAEDVAASLDLSDAPTVSLILHDYRWLETAILRHSPEALTPAQLRRVSDLVREAGEAAHSAADWVGREVFRFSPAGPCLPLGTVERATAKTWFLTGDRLGGKSKVRVSSRFHVRGSCTRCSGRADGSYPQGYQD